MYREVRLRTKFLLSMLAVTAALTAATLVVVSRSIEKRVRESFRAELNDSVKTYQAFELQRGTVLERSAQMLANLPNVRALMSTNDPATVQDATTGILELSGGDLVVLSNRQGQILGLRTRSGEFGRSQAQDLLRVSIDRSEVSSWWYDQGRLYQVWLQPIYFGAAEARNVTGAVAVGHEITQATAQEFGGVVSSEIVFQCGENVVASTLADIHAADLSGGVNTKSAAAESQELQHGNQRYLATRVNLSRAGDRPVTLTVLKSLDQGMLFVNRLNRILLALGLASIVAGGLLVFFISHTFTKPLANLFAGVHALEHGDFNYPLEPEIHDEVGEVTGAFERMRSSLRRSQEEQRELESRLRQAHKMEAVGRLAGGIAHDFNNLLTVIRGNSDLLLDRQGADSPQRRNLEQIHKAADRAVSMTRQLLAFSRMQVLQPKVLDLNATIQDMCKMIPRLIGEHIEFSFLPSEIPAMVLADRSQMEQVFLNLAVNARDAMPSGGKLSAQIKKVQMSEVEARERSPMAPGEYVLLTVADTGQGMTAHTKAHLFEPFFTTKEAGKGTGLGLATVYGVVKQSGGFIWVESEIGRGASFEIYLPYTDKTAPVPGDRGAEKQVPGGRETILVVEDEAAVRELACEFLRSGGYRVLEANEGAEALQIVARYKDEIHLLVTDVVMPRMSGIALADKLRERRPALRVIYVTGYAEYSGENKEAIQPDGNVLQKPFSQPVLLARVREALAGATAGLEIDTKKPC